MNKPEFKITFNPGRICAVVPGGSTLLDAARIAGIFLDAPCSGSGKCGKCRIRIVSGASSYSDTEINALGKEAVEKGWRLACQCRVISDLIVEIPAHGDLSGRRHRILVAGTGADVVSEPAIKKFRFDIQPPDSLQGKTDISRLEFIAEKAGVPHCICRQIADTGKKKGVAVIINRELAGIEDENTTENVFGLAFDIGTTTIAGSLVNLTNGKEMAVEACLNPQIKYGDDVVTRIQRSRDEPGMRGNLQSAVADAADMLIEKMTTECSVSRREIYEVVISGNTAMQQLFCGLDSSSLCQAPFTPVFYSSIIKKATSLGLVINDLANVVVSGQIGGFVGGDTLACMVAARIDSFSEPVLLIDIGTNGEIVLCSKEKILAASAAAGPALEGARIKHGMRAASGAIEKVEIKDDVCCTVIGGGAPAGICGSGLVDAVAGMLDAGILDVSGLMLAPGKNGAGVNLKLYNRVISGDNGLPAFVLVDSNKKADSSDIDITQKDIREFQLACGAIRAAVNILLKKAEITCSDIGTVLVAGAFGSYIRPASALRTGLLPPVPEQKIKYTGNTSLAGARMMLVSVAEREYAERLRTKTTHIDLSLEPDFFEEFTQAMIFPG